MVYANGSVPRDQSGWGFTVKQGATTIHKGNAAYTVSKSSLTIDLEAVTHAICWNASRGDSPTHMPSSSRVQELATKVKSETGSPDRHVSMFDIHLRKLLKKCCPGNTVVKGDDRADRLAGKGGLRLGRSEMLRSL